MTAVEAFKQERWIPLRYKQHMKYLLRKVITMERHEEDLFRQYFRKKEKEDMQIEVGMWSDVETNKKKKIVQCVLVVVLTICFYFGIFGFYMALDFEKASEEGLDFLWNIEWYYWISAGVFVLVSCIYYFNSVKRSVMWFFLLPKTRAKLYTRGYPFFVSCVRTKQNFQHVGNLLPYQFFYIIINVTSYNTLSE